MVTILKVGFRTFSCQLLLPQGTQETNKILVEKKKPFRHPPRLVSYHFAFLFQKLAVVFYKIQNTHMSRIERRY